MLAADRAVLGERDPARLRLPRHLRHVGPDQQRRWSAAALIDEPIDFLGLDVGIYAGLSYAYLLMMMFPLYNAIESLDKNQIEAARDLGAPWWHIHLFVVMPFAKPGIASGCTMVFMLTAGALAAPLILGGPNSLWFTPIVYAASPGLQLAAGLGLRLHPAADLHRLRAGGAARVQGEPRGDHPMSSRLVMKAMIGVLHGALLHLSVRAAAGDGRHRLQHAQLSAGLSVRGLHLAMVRRCWRTTPS